VADSIKTLLSASGVLAHVVVPKEIDLLLQALAAQRAPPRWAGGSSLARLSSPTTSATARAEKASCLLQVLALPRSIFLATQPAQFLTRESGRAVRALAFVAARPG
jgi:hypothetical protein